MPIPVEITIRSTCLSTTHHTLTLDNCIGTDTRLCRNTIHLTPLGVSSAILTALFHIHEANGNHCRGTYGKEEWEAHPIVARVVDNGLDNVWSDDGGLLIAWISKRRLEFENDLSMLTARLVIPKSAKNMLSYPRGINSLIIVWAYYTSITLSADGHIC